jgi:hypothetical protein
MFLPHSRHITSPLRAPQVNATITILGIIHGPVFYLKHTMGNVCTS